MFERYSEVALRSLFFARYEVSVLGGQAIETHHLLLGLVTVLGLGLTRSPDRISGRVTGPSASP